MDISRILSFLPDVALCGVYIYSLQNSRNEYINASYTQITGWELDDMQSMSAETFWELFHADDRAAVRAHIQTVIQSPIGQADEIEYRFKHKLGHWIWCKSRDVVVEKDGDGEPSLFMGSFIDVSGKKRLEDQLNTSEERLTLAVDAAEIGIWDYDLQAGVSDNDRRVHEQFDMDWGATPDVEAWFERIHKEDADTVRQAIESAIAGNGEYDARYRVCWRDGSVHHLMAKGKIIQDQSGNPARLLGMNIDVTDQVELQQQLEQKQKMDAIGQLAGGIAHDFNNQLMAVLGNADLLRTRLADENLLSYVNAILKAANRSADLTKQLLNYARRGVSMHKPFDIEHMINDVVAILSHSIDKRISLHFDYQEPHAILLGDENNLQSALLNLALNARDAMPDGGRLTFATCVHVVTSDDTDELRYQLKPGRYLRVSVIDTGEGMSEAIQQKVREPFFTTKDVGKGTGLGLPACDGIVRRHGGELLIESVEGVGTQVHVYLPYPEADQSRVQTKNNQASSSQQDHLQVLVIDDEELGIRVVETILTDHGHVVHCETSPKRALQYFEQACAEIDLVLLDMTMPELNGTEVFHELRRIDPSQRIVIFSGHSPDGAVNALVELGNASFLQKPFTVQQMLTAVQG